MRGGISAGLERRDDDGEGAVTQEIPEAEIRRALSYILNIFISRRAYFASKWKYRVR